MRLIDLSCFAFGISLALATGCTQSHPPGTGEDAGGTGGGDAGVGSGSTSSGGGSTSTGSGSAGSGSAGSGSGGSGSGSGSGGSGSTGGTSTLDVLDLCIEACDHLSTCSPEYERLECIDDCLSVRDALGDTACEALVIGIFDCLRALSCADISEDLSGTECAPLLDAFEDGCIGDEPPAAAPMR